MTSVLVLEWPSEPLVSPQSVARPSEVALSNNPDASSGPYQLLLTSCQVFINIAVATNNAVDATKRGELNGLGMAVNSMVRALAPVVLSVIFAWSIQRPRPFPFGPHLAFLLLGLGMLVVAVIGWKVIKGSR